MGGSGIDQDHEESPGSLGGGHHEGPSQLLTKAVLVPVVRIAPGDRNGDGVELAGFCSLCKNKAGSG